MATELSDRPVGPDDVVPCPPECPLSGHHRHLIDGTVQFAHQGFGVDDQGKIHLGPIIEGMTRGY